MANVSVSNTTGLYIGSGQSRVLTNAQQLLSLLSNNGGVSFALDPAFGNSRVEAFSSTYSNANIASYLPTYTGLLGGTLTTAAQPNVTSVGTLTSLTATGNITTSNYFIGNGSLLTGVTGTGNYGNANVAAYLPTYTGNLVSLTGAVTTTANITGAYIFGNGSQLTGLPATYGNANVAAYLPTYTGLLGGTLSTAAQPNVTSVGTLTSLTSSGNVSAVYFLGNGSQLTGLPATYSNANVAAYLPTYTGNLVSLTGAVTTTANVSGAYIFGNGSQLSGITVNYSNVNVAAYLPTYTGLLGGTLTTAAQPNITSVGTLTSVTTSGNVTAAYANISATVFASNIVTSGSSGNITGANYINANFFVGNGSLLTGISGSGNYGDSNVAAFLPTYTGNLNNVTAVPGSAITGTVANATYATSAGSATTATTATTAQFVTGLTSGNVTTALGYVPLDSNTTITSANIANVAYSLQAQSPTPAGNITFDGGGNMTLRTTASGGGNATVNIYSGVTVSGANCVTRLDGGATATNLTVGFISSNANVTTSANVQAAYFIGNGSQLTGISGGGTPGGASTYIQYNNAGSFDGSANLIYSPTDGNITLGNLVFNKNYNRILQTNAFDTTGQSSTQNAVGQFIIGDGWNGNVTSPSFNNNQLIDGAFALVNKAYVKSDNGRRSSGLGVQTFVNVTANMTQSGTRIGSIANWLRVGGNTTQTVVNATTLVGLNNGLIVGGGTGTFASLGNANLRTAAGTVSSVNPQVNSFVGNAFGYISNLEGTANNQFLDRMVNYTVWSPSAYTTPGAYYAYHMPNSTSYAGININSSVRQAPQYYFLYNEDDVAQVQLGSLRRYTEYRANITSSGGNLTVNKNTAQVQYLTPTENVTSVTFSNFVTSASNGANNITQTDTVTLIVQQGSTPYNITMPSGSEYKYAGNVRTVGNTANSVTMISTTATKDVSGGTDLYLITISPEFV